MVGIDEAGRGAWAGPMSVAAVSLHRSIEGLTDSKQLSPTNRERLFSKIQQTAGFIRIFWVSASEIDSMGLSTGMYRACEYLTRDCTDEIVVDGVCNYLPDHERARAVPKADQLFENVAAASVVAKVLRDRYMKSMTELFPGYGFEKHMGYGTSLHRNNLVRLGVSSFHRRSFKPVAGLNGQ